MNTLNDLLWTDEEDDLVVIQGVGPVVIDYFSCTIAPQPSSTMGTCG